MTDEELCAALRVSQWDVRQKAADRIEALVRERDHQRRGKDTMAKGWRISDDGRIEAEARLAKAVVALRRMADGSSDNSEAEARTALAEIGGEA
jgi:hypothetical protein